MVIIVILEARHSDRFGTNRGPMPVGTRNFFVWIAVILGLAVTYWQTQHGNISYP
jgi:hypothetical protein